MKSLTISVAVTGAVLGFGSAALAQGAGAKLFFEGDMVRGGQAGAPGPVCVLDNQFKHLEKIVWRFRVLDENGKSLDDKGLKSLVVEMPDGQEIDARFGPHPGGPNPTDFFWTAAWMIPENYPTGSLGYSITATDMEGNTVKWEPLREFRSWPSVIAGTVEYVKQAQQ